MAPADREVYVLNELTLLPFLACCLAGRRPFLAGVLPLVRLAGVPLRLLAERLLTWGVCRPASAFSEGLRWSENMPDFGWYNDIHITLEARLHDAFNPQPRSPAQHWYDYAARKVVSDAAADAIPALLVAEWAERNLPAGSWSVRGISAFGAWIHQAYWGRKAPFSSGRAAMVSVLFNLLNLLTALIAGVAWLTPRLRMGVVQEACMLAVDAHTDLEARVLKRLLAPGEKGVAIFRTAAARAEMAPLFAGYSCRTVGDARVTPARALWLGGRLIRDLSALFRLYGRSGPELFGRLSVLAVKRCMWDAFFDGLLPANFWCRDDYAIDHPVRNKTLRDRGGRSLGINHGIPINTYFYAYREIDCDAYFVHGEALIPYYRDLWPAHMSAQAIGCVHQPPRGEVLPPRDRDIVVFATVVEDIDWLMDQIRALAVCFPERRIWVRTKADTDKDFLEAVDRLLAGGPENLVRHTASVPYELLRHCGYSISTGSTVTLEAIAFGMPSFVFDVWARWKYFYFRNNAPEIVVADAADLARRIKAVEDGSRPYPFAACEPVIRQGCDPFEEIRKKMTGSDQSSIVPASQ